MESSSDSGSEFEGFAPDIMGAAQRQLLELVEVNPEDISDVDISDISDIETNSDGEIGEDPLPNIEDGDRCAWREELQNIDLQAFTEIPGPTTVLDGTAVEMDFFHLMFPPTYMKKSPGKLTDTRTWNKKKMASTRDGKQQPLKKFVPISLCKLLWASL